MAEPFSFQPDPPKLEEFVWVLWRRGEDGWMFMLEFLSEWLFVDKPSEHVLGDPGDVVPVVVVAEASAQAMELVAKTAPPAGVSKKTMSARTRSLSPLHMPGALMNISSRTTI